MEDKEKKVEPEEEKAERTATQEKTHADKVKGFHPFWETVKYITNLILTAPVRLVQALTLLIEKKAGIDVSKQEQAANRELRIYEQRRDANKLIKEHLDPTFKEQIALRDSTIKQTPLDIVQVKSSVAENGAKDILYQFNVTLRNGLEYSIFANNKNEIMDSSVCPDEVLVQMQEMFKNAVISRVFTVENETGSKEDDTIQKDFKEPEVSRTSNGIIDFTAPGDNAFQQATYLYNKETVEDNSRFESGKVSRDIAMYIDWKLKEGGAPEKIAVSYNGIFVSAVAHDGLATLTVRDIKSGLGDRDHTVTISAKNIKDVLKRSIEQIKTTQRELENEKKANEKSKSAEHKKQAKKEANIEPKFKIPFRDGMYYMNELMKQDECQKYHEDHGFEETSAADKAQAVINILVDSKKEKVMTVYDQNMMFVRKDNELSVYEFGREEPIEVMAMDDIGPKLAKAIMSVEPSKIDLGEVESEKDDSAEIEQEEIEKDDESNRTESTVTRDNRLYNDDPER